MPDALIPLGGRGERRGQTCEIAIPLPPLAEHERNVAKLEKLMKFCDELEANIKQGITNADRPKLWSRDGMRELI